MAATVLSAGSVTISATGGATGDLLQSIVNASASYTVVTVGSGATSIPAAPTTGGPYELVIQPGYTGSLSIPSGYALVIDGATNDTGTIMGGDASTAIVLSGSASSYSGAAGTVVGAGTGVGGMTPGAGNIADSSPGAMISFFGDYNVSASGDGQTITSDNGSSGTVTATGTGDTINLGTPATDVAGATTTPSTTTVIIDASTVSGSAAGPISDASGAGGATTVNAGTGDNSLVYVVTPTDFIQTGGAATVAAIAAGVLDYNGAGDTSSIQATVLDDFGGSTVTGGAHLYYANDAGATTMSTITGTAGGADTIWALQSVDYDGSAAASSFLAAGYDGASSATVGANASVFTGSAGGTYMENAASTGSMVFLGNSLGQASTVVANDTLEGAAGSQSVVAWTNNRENLTISQTGTATYGGGGAYVDYGATDTINATNSSGGDSFVIWNTSVGSGSFVGNSTLVGSNAGDDLFAVINGTVAGGTGAAAPHTVTIDNWVASDHLNLLGYSTADDQTALNALTKGGGGSASFTLSDGTTISFQGTSPTHLFANGSLFG